MAKGSGSTRIYSPSKNIERSVANVSSNKLIEVHERIAAAASARLKQILEDKIKYGYSKDANAFKFGKLSNDAARKFEEITGIVIKNKDIYTGQKAMFHHRGGQKAEANKESSFEDIINMPLNIGKMDAYVHTGAIIFTDYKNKFVLKPNEEVRISKEKVIVTNHISSSKVKDASDFTEEKGYIKITL